MIEFAKLCSMQRLLRAIQGFSLVLFIWIAVEVIPYRPNLNALPPFFTLRTLVEIYPPIASVSTFWFLPVALLFFLIAIWPIMSRPVDWGSSLLVCIGLVGIPLSIYFKQEAWASYLGSFPVLIFIGVNLWVRHVDYFYSGLLAGSCFDGISAYRALRGGLSTVPQFYDPDASISTVLIIDSVVALGVLFLWIIKIRRKKSKGAQNLGGSGRVVWQGQGTVQDSNPDSPSS